jgi:hypothetical protein
MNARTPLLAIACCAIAALAIIALAAREPSHGNATPGSSDFSARFQPVLDGIGSARDLTLVQLGDAQQAQTSQPGGPVAKANRHEHGARPP